VPEAVRLMAHKHPLAQAQTFVRSARRAECKADWLLAQPPGSVGMTDAELRAEVSRLRQRSEHAADQLVRLVRDNPDAGWTLPQQRAAAAWETER
jgi:hypothetical protein